MRVEIPIAKMNYVKSKTVWKVFWQRADMKWHSYQPAPLVKSVEEYLKVVDTDANHCFFG